MNVEDAPWRADERRYGLTAKGYGKPPRNLVGFPVKADLSLPAIRTPEEMVEERKVM